MPFVVQSVGSAMQIYFADDDSISDTVTYQIFGINTDDVNTERDRLSIVLVAADGEYTFSFSLEVSDGGAKRLRFDPAHSSTEVVDALKSCVEEELGSFDIEEWAIYYSLYPYPGIEDGDQLQIVSPLVLLFHKDGSDVEYEFSPDSTDDLPELNVKNYTIP
jgi:hypothetical protein